MSDLREQLKKIIREVTKDYRLQHKDEGYYETDLLFDNLPTELENLINKEYVRKEDMVVECRKAFIAGTTGKPEDVEEALKTHDEWWNNYQTKKEDNEN